MLHPLCSEAVATGLPSSLATDVQQLKVSTVQRGGQEAVSLELTVFRARAQQNVWHSLYLTIGMLIPATTSFS